MTTIQRIEQERKEMADILASSEFIVVTSCVMERIAEDISTKGMTEVFSDLAQMRAVDTLTIANRNAEISRLKDEVAELEKKLIPHGIGSDVISETMRNAG